jgi:hypothetical protein
MTTPAPSLPDLTDLVHLLEAQRAKQERVARPFDQAYSGERRVTIVEQDYSEVFSPRTRDGRNDPAAQLRDWGGRLAPPYTHIAPIGVDVTAERLRIGGWESASPGAADAMVAAWERNDLDVMHETAHVEALVQGRVFGLVLPDESGLAQVSIEHPADLAVLRSPNPPYAVVVAGRREVRDGEVRWRLWDDTNEVLLEQDRSPSAALLAAPLLLPQVGQAAAPSLEQVAPVRGMAYGDLDGPVASPLEAVTVNPAAAVTGGRWRVVSARPHGCLGVPVTEIANRTRLKREPSSDLVGVLPLADAHTKLVADLVIAASFGAIPIRTATGITLPRDKVTGEPRSPFDVRADRAWMSENKDARFGSLEASQLAGYVQAIEVVTAQVRLITRIPEHYYGQGARAGQTGQTLPSAEAGLDRKVGGIRPRYGAGWRRIATQVAWIDTRGRTAGQQVRPVWADARLRDQARDSDYVVKMTGAGVPLRVALEQIGFSTEVLDRIDEIRREDPSTATQDVLRAVGAPDPLTVKAQADALGALVRAGVDPQDAAARAGLSDLDFTGAVPVSLRLPESAAAALE